MGDRYPYPPLFLAVLATAAYGGLGPALLSVALGAASAAYFLIPPRGSFKVDGLDGHVGMALYAVTGLGIAVLGETMRRARQRAEDGARKAQGQAALGDHIHEAVLAWEWNGPITFWNRGAEQLYGFSQTEALNQVSHDLLRTRAEGGIDGFVGVLEREGRWEGELEQFTRDGRRVIVESRMVLIRETGRAFVLETNRDVTLRKKAEAALREANNQLELRVRERAAELAKANASLHETQERFRLVVAGVKDYAILMLDREGRVASWNRGAEHIKGFRAEDILGRHFSRFYPQEDIDARQAGAGIESGGRRGSISR